MMKKSCAVVWFRKDLRVHDHRALYEASKSDLPVIGLYCFNPKQYEKTSFGFEKTGALRAKFILESLEVLRESLHKLGTGLLIKISEPVHALEELEKTYEIKHIYYHKELGSEEQQEEKEVTNIYETSGYYGHNLYALESLPFEINNLSNVFTHFRTKMERQAQVDKLISTPKSIKGIENLKENKIPTLKKLGLKDISQDERCAIKFQGGSRAGKKRLDHYFFDTESIKSYKKTRNGFIGEDFSSKFSPWLAQGCLSPRYIYYKLKEYENEYIENESTYWLYFEIMWREYFWLLHYKYKNQFFHAEGLQKLDMPWSQDQKKIDAWTKGETGYPLVDANMLELRLGGYMSNRGRQLTASFFTKNLGLDWRIGAEWFESCLIDYDVSSNYGNWMYAAGVGNDTRMFRAFNVEKQAKDFDPKGEYIRRWIPALKDLEDKEVIRPYAAEKKLDYPAPIVELNTSRAQAKEVYQDAVKKRKEADPDNDQ